MSVLFVKRYVYVQVSLHKKVSPTPGLLHRPAGLICTRLSIAHACLSYKNSGCLCKSTSNCWCEIFIIIVDLNACTSNHLCAMSMHQMHTCVARLGNACSCIPRSRVHGHLCVFCAVSTHSSCLHILSSWFPGADTCPLPENHRAMSLGGGGSRGSRKLGL